MISETEFGSLLGHVYDAALEPNRWAETLGHLGAALRGAKTIMAVHSWRGAVQWASINGVDPASLPAYEEDFSSSDSNEYFQLCRKVPLDEPISAEHFAAPRDFLQTDFYRTILAPQGLRHSVIVTLLRDQRSVAAAAFLRDERHGPFSADELATLRLVAPHLRRALKLTLRTEMLRVRSTTFLEALRLSPTGTMLLDSSRQITFFNPAAARVLDENDGLSMRDCVLELADSVTRERVLDRFARARSARESDLEWSCSEPITVPRPSGKPAYHLFVWPLRVEPVAAPIDVPTALVLVADSSSDAAIPGETLQKIYGLTPTETQLAVLLLKGFTVKRSAGELGVSVNTVKTHMKSVFLKTRTHRQTDLVRVLLQFPALLP